MTQIKLWAIDIFDRPKFDMDDTKTIIQLLRSMFSILLSVASMIYESISVVDSP
jgi:hypothetical protein